MYLTQAGREPPKWSYTEEKLGGWFRANFLPKEQAAAGLAASGEAWELQLNRLQIEPLEIRASRDEPWNGPLPVSLACVPLASSQHAMLTVRAAGDVRLGISNARLDAVEPARAPAGSIDSVRACIATTPSARRLLKLRRQSGLSWRMLRPCRRGPWRGASASIRRTSPAADRCTRPRGKLKTTGGPLATWCWVLASACSTCGLMRPCNI